MGYIPDAPVFADRYRFEPVPAGSWDTGRTGYTYLVYDLEKKRRGVIKRADATSKQSVAELRNEISALNALKGFGVPNVYETGQAIYDSKKYDYVVIEYISSLRIEDNLQSLSASDRIEILTQFFGILDKSHKLGIVNGDVDLKHLFWDGNKKQLRVIDWGNARLTTDPRNTTEFSYDLARSAEIIYSLTSMKGHPPATGSLALPNDSQIFHGLIPIPEGFKKLCKWAPRTPVEGIHPPYISQELLEIANNWKKEIQGKKFPKEQHNTNKLATALGVLFFIVFTFGTWLLWPKITANLFWLNTTTIVPISFSETPTPSVNIGVTTTSTPTSTTTSAPPASTKTLTPTLTLTLHPTTTPSPEVTPLPLTNKALLTEFAEFTPSQIDCWSNSTNPERSINRLEGFTRRDDNNWRFNIDQKIDPNVYIQTDFKQCFVDKDIVAFGANILVSKLETKRNASNTADDKTNGKGFGFFIEDANQKRREYTIWVDETSSMYLRVREGNKVIVDSVIFVVNPKSLKIVNDFPRLYTSFPIQIYLEINNQGLDIIYLREGSINYQALDPTQMTRVDIATQKTMGNIGSLGLIGYDGEINIGIWPLVFFGEP